MKLEDIVQTERHYAPCEYCGRTLLYVTAKEDQCASPTWSDIAHRLHACEQCVEGGKWQLDGGEFIGEVA